MAITCIEEQLARDEGREAVPYLDTKGWATGGIGHNFRVRSLDQVPMQFRPRMTDQQIDALFAADLHNVYDLLDIYVPWWASLDGNTGPRTGVLLNMGFNLGVQGLAQFHGFLSLMHAKNWDGAARDLRTGTAVYKELPVRYERLAKQIETGVWQ